MYCSLYVQTPCSVCMGTSTPQTRISVTKELLSDDKALGTFIKYAVVEASKKNICRPCRDVLNTEAPQKETK